MAKFTSGSIIGQITGSVGGSTYSRNRYGQYIRQRVKPVVSTTPYAQAAKGRLATVSRAWSALSDAQRAAWVAWAQNNPVIDVLGHSQILSGHAAYVMLNARLNLSGDAAISLPPIGRAPDALATLAVAAAAGAGTVGLTYTATPLGAGQKLWVSGCVVSSAGITYVKNLLREFTISAAAQASPLAAGVAFVARFGTMTAGQKVTIYASVFDSATGLISAPLRADATVAA